MDIQKIKDKINMFCAGFGCISQSIREIKLKIFLQKLFLKNKIFYIRHHLQLDIQAILTPQITTIIHHHMKKILLKK